jgi:hypothetical protein
MSLEMASTFSSGPSPFSADENLVDDVADVLDVDDDDDDCDARENELL